MKKKHIIWFAVLQLAILLFSLANCRYHGLSPAIGAGYFLFQLIGIMLPGLAAFLFFDIKNRSGAAVIGISYALGLVLLIIEYLMVSAAGIQKYSWCLSFVIAVCSFIYIAKRRGRIEGRWNDSGYMLCMIFILLIFFLDLFSVSFANTIPGEISGNSYYVDWLFWTGNNISFTKGFPPQDYRLCGEIFNYHYFSSIVIAQSHFVTGIDTVVLSFYFSFMIPAVLLATVSYTFFSSVLKKREYVILAMIITLFAEGSSLTFISHIYFCPFGFDYGYIFGMLSVYVLSEIIKKRDLSVKMILLSASLISMTTGCKGPVGIVILMGFGAVSLYYILQKRFKKGILLGVIWLGAFLLTYFVFISGDVTASEASLKFLGIRGAFKVNPYIKKIYSSLTEGYGFAAGRVTKIITILLYLYNLNKAAVLLFIIGILYLLYAWFHKQIDLCLLICCTICPWGMALTITTAQQGGSEMYFMMSVIPYGAAAGFYAIERMRKMKYLYLNIMLSVVVTAMYMNFSSFLYNAYFKSMQGLLCIRNQQDISDFSKYYAAKADYEAYEWIKNHTDKEAIIAVDYLFDTNSQTQQMVAGVFSERYIWNDGKYSVNASEIERRKGIIERLLNGDDSAVIELKENGVTYFMQNLAVNPSFILEKESGTCVYENSSFRVYKLD
ncbi:hypothetical protein D3Z50_06195 [Clostridiaceae bacterium]|nr:hypothetical protein [Clostridiaceae bacterium]